MAMASPPWSQIDRELVKNPRLTAVRIVHSYALLNGPFSIIVAMDYFGKTTMFGLTDRIKLRPLVAARKDITLYISSEGAIRQVCPNPERVWALKAGVPEVATLDSRSN